jgi:hypothetical protein
MNGKLTAFMTAPPRSKEETFRGLSKAARPISAVTVALPARPVNGPDKKDADEDGRLAE